MEAGKQMIENIPNVGPILAEKINGFLSRTQIATDEEEERYFFENVICGGMKQAGFESRFFKEFCGGFGCADQDEVLAMVKGLLKQNGAIIALIGARGTGKTTIVSQIALNMIRDWHRWRATHPENRTGKPPIGMPIYRKLIEVSARLKAFYADFGTIQNEELAAYRSILCSTGLLILDEKHDADELRATGRILTDILDRRYAAQKDSIIISNQSEEEFRATTSDSVLSRLHEHGLIIECNWQSFRAKRAA